MVKCPEDNLNFLLFAFLSLISTNVQWDLCWQDPLFFYVLEWCNKCDTTSAIFNGNSISAAAEGILSGAHNSCNIFLVFHVSPQYSPLQAFSIKGVYYGPEKSPWSLHFHPLACVYHNDAHTRWHVCKILCTVTPLDKGSCTKAFPCCFTASLMISTSAGWMRCVPPIRLSMTQGSRCNATAAFSCTERKPNQYVCFDQLGVLWWMGCRA